MLPFSVRWRWFVLGTSLVLFCIASVLTRLPHENELRTVGSINDLAFSPDGLALAAVVTDRLIVWDVATRRVLATLPYVYRSLAWSPSGKLLAGGNGDGVTIWTVGRDSTFSQSSISLPGDNLASSPVFSLAWSKDSTLLGAGHYDGTVRIWRMPDATLVGTLRGEAPIENLIFSPDGQQIATIDIDVIHVWQLANNQLHFNLQNTYGFKDVTWSADRGLLASCSPDGFVQVWQASDGQRLRTFKAHADAINSIVFSPDSQLLATGAGLYGYDTKEGPKDMSVRVWRVLDGSLLHTFVGHRNMVTSVTFSPDGTMLASASFDRSIRLWSLK